MKFAELTAPQIRALAPHTPIVFPIAAIEQHGQHLPVVTDSLLLGEIIDRVQKQLDDRILFAPLQWLGNSHHHLEFNGTLSASPRTYLDMLNDLIDNAIFQGFRRIVFVNGHGGNDVPGKQAIFEARQRYRTRSDLLILMATYWSFDSKPWEVMPSIEQREMGHACEWETSMVLAIRPDLVGDFQRQPEISLGYPFHPGSRAWITSDRTGPGHIGKCSVASADKGRVLFDAFSRDVAKWLELAIDWDGQP